MENFHTIAELLRLASERQVPVHEIVLMVEADSLSGHVRNLLKGCGRTGRSCVRR